MCSFLPHTSWKQLLSIVKVLSRFSCVNQLCWFGYVNQIIWLSCADSVSCIVNKVLLPQLFGRTVMLLLVLTSLPLLPPIPSRGVGGQPWLQKLLPSHVLRFLKLCRKMSPKTCDLDPIPTSLLLECIDKIAPVLTDIVNDCLSTGSVPDSLKLAIVKPPKRSRKKKTSLDPNILKEIRPVSKL